MSLYPFHTADEIAAFTKPQRAAYDRERAAFDLEVWAARAAVAAWDGGRINVVTSAAFDRLRGLVKP